MKCLNRLSFPLGFILIGVISLISGYDFGRTSFQEIIEAQIFVKSLEFLFLMIVDSICTLLLATH